MSLTTALGHIIISHGSPAQIPSGTLHGAATRQECGTCSIGGMRVQEEEAEEEEEEEETGTGVNTGTGSSAEGTQQRVGQDTQGRHFRYNRHSTRRR
jgi:hypothetical protein